MPQGADGNLQIGENEIDAIYLGDSEVDKIYWGSNEVWISVVPPSFSPSERRITGSLTVLNLGSYVSGTGPFTWTIHNIPNGTTATVTQTGQVTINHMQFQSSLQVRAHNSAAFAIFRIYRD